ncbi:MAG: hypothetical protein WBA59_06065 [Moheibacter sp.]
MSGTAGDISTMLFGSVSGGLSAELTGGNFWQGAATGLTVSALNHVAHSIIDPKNAELMLLSDKEGAKGAGHGAVGVGSDKKGWHYRSNEGTDENGGVYGESIKVERTYNTKAEMLNDVSLGDYNTDRYDRAAVFKIRQSQVAKVVDAVSIRLNSNYNLFTNNCAHLWNAALGAIGNKFHGGVFGPNAKFQQIRNWYWPSHWLETRHATSSWSY